MRHPVVLEESDFRVPHTWIHWAASLGKTSSHVLPGPIQTQDLLGRKKQRYYYVTELPQAIRRVTVESVPTFRWLTTDFVAIIRVSERNRRIGRKDISFGSARSLALHEHRIESCCGYSHPFLYCKSSASTPMESKHMVRHHWNTCYWTTLYSRESKYERYAAFLLNSLPLSLEDAIQKSNVDVARKWRLSSI
jgi:hypothetical protein